MLDVLKFVRGAVAKKDFAPALTHFHIANGFITGYNGRIALRSPIALDLNACPRAVDFVKAIETCRQEVALHITPNGRLSVKSGGFKAFIECTTEPFPDIHPSGKMISVKPDLLDAMKQLYDFTADDASRPWAMGILFRGECAYATNNIILMEYWMGYHFPCEVVIPATTVAELLRIGVAPTHMQVDKNSVTFHFKDKRWLHSVLYDAAWPDIGKALNRPSNPSPPPEGLFNALRDIKPFLDEHIRVYLQPGHLGTSPLEGEGVDIDLPALQNYGCYNVNQMLLLDGVIKSIDLSQYPTHALFFNDHLRGAIAAMRG